MPEYSPPADRVPPGWTPGTYVGVYGGIPTRTNLIDVTQSPYNADKTGTEYSDVAVLDALTAATTNDVIYFPAGTYKFQYSSPLNLNKNNITFRGEVDANGNALVTLNLQGGASGANIVIGTSYSPAGTITISAGLTKGSDTLTVNSTAGLSAGNILRIQLNNDPALPVVSVASFDAIREQWVRIVSVVDGTHVEIWPTIYGTYGVTGGAAVVTSYISGCGVENFILEAANGNNAPLQVSNSYNCWVKNVQVNDANNMPFKIMHSLHIEVEGCWFDSAPSSASNHSGIHTTSISACLIENNIVTRGFPGIEINDGSSGNVIAYNVIDGSGKGIDTNHAPHPHYNLYEGNVTGNFQTDGYFGSVSHDYVFRNYIVGSSAVDGLSGGGIGGIIVNRFSYKYTFVGNLLPGRGSFGNPNLSNGEDNGGVVRPSDNDFWYADWDTTAQRAKRWVGTVASGGGTTSITMTLATGEGTLLQWHKDNVTSAYENQAMAYTSAGSQLGRVFIGTITGDFVELSTDQFTFPANSTEFFLTGGYMGFQERDQDTFPSWHITWAGTTLMKGNHYLDAPTTANVESGAPGIPVHESLGTDTLPNSMYRTSAPSWFAGLTWPAFDPASPNRDYTRTPAGYRFAYGWPLNGSNRRGLRRLTQRRASIGRRRR